MNMQTEKSTKKPEHPARSKSQALPSENKIAWAAAVGAHVLLVLIFALINVGWRYDIPEWIEMEFARVNQHAVALQEQPESIPQQPDPAPSAREQLEEQAKEDVNKTIINLPKRRMLENEKPVLTNERRDFATSSDVTGALERSSEERKPEFDVLARSQTEGTGKAIAELENLETGDKTIQASAADLGKSVEVPFQIEGEAANRKVLKKVIPQYPPGLTREAVVKLSFQVLPNGVVANVVPVLKGDATLEQIAVEAFRQWRFNELAQDFEQRNQRGVITFRFVLR